MSFSLQENDFREPHRCGQYVVAGETPTVDHSKQSVVEGAATSPRWDLLGASWAIGRRTHRRAG